jgi:23S rRNA (uracil1939-C5)-methyltransferase
VLEASEQRVEPEDEAYLSTSPWQIYSFEAEEDYKRQLIEEAFALAKVTLPEPVLVKTDRRIYGYRNKVEFSFWFDTDTEQLDLAFFRRGTHGKISVQSTALARPEINAAARQILQALRDASIGGRDLKTLLLRSTADGAVVAQLYVKDPLLGDRISFNDLASLGVQGLEIIYSNPKSPASVITERLATLGKMTLTDTVRKVSFNYSAESFFQVNLSLYEMALRDMHKFVLSRAPVVDMYSGVGTIGLTIGGRSPILIELNEAAVTEMRRNIVEHASRAQAVLASSESALEYIDEDSLVIVDPPRAGLHNDVVERILDTLPPRIIYLSCNPVTQARDVGKLLESYTIIENVGYNFFPRTPHIEHLVVLECR